eukprot:2755164-Pleurochrysis_carterae.AAC.1
MACFAPSSPSPPNTHTHARTPSNASRAGLPGHDVQELRYRHRWRLAREPDDPGAQRDARCWFGECLEKRVPARHTELCMGGRESQAASQPTIDW